MELFNCNSLSDAYLITCEYCLKQYVSPTITKNDTYLININQIESIIAKEGEIRAVFVQEHNAFYHDMDVQIANYCKPNDP